MPNEIDKNDEQYFDDILRIFEARERREGNFDVDDFIEQYTFGEKIEELEDIESYDDEIKWIKENPKDEEFIVNASFKNDLCRLPSYFVADKQEEQTLDIREIIDRFNKDKDSIISYSTIEDTKTNKTLEVLDNILSKIAKCFCNLIDYITEEERVPKIVVGLIIAGYCTLSTIDARLNDECREEWIRANSNGNTNTKHEELVEEERIYSNTTFVQKKEGSVTNNILETDVYKEFEEYARSNNLVMNTENFEDFCDSYYNGSTNGRGR